MRHLAWLLLVCMIGCSDRQSSPSRSRASSSGPVAELEALPVGLEVVHTPARVENPRQGDKRSGWAYQWVFGTEVRAIERPLTIAQFGILAWDGENWILPPDQTKYNAGILGQAEFTEWYECPTGRIEPGKPAVDPKNWAGSHTRSSFKQKWFFIGVDSKGQRYKGEAVVELVAND